MSAILVTALSHDGAVRDHNEDSLVVGPWTTCAVTTSTPQTLAFPLRDPVVVAVADGLGGHPAGELASSVVVESLARVGHLLVDEDVLRDAVIACNETVFAQARLDPGRVGMGTTVAGVVMAAGSVLVFNVGDSRVYAAGPSGLTLVSNDDSPPLARGQTHTSVVTQTLGGAPVLTPVEPHVTRYDVDPAARYLVCTDGLTDAVEDDAIATVLGELTGAEAIFALWRAAMTAGGPDNITIALVEPVEVADLAAPTDHA